MGDEQVARAAKRQGKEGNRWVNQRPSAEELGDWFGDNVHLAEGLDHADYVGGVTLIPGREKSQEVVGWDQFNSPVLQYVYDLCFTPYMRVETRVKYFHDLMAREKWLGFIEPVLRETQDPVLPPGFFRFAITTKPGFEARYIGCSMKVTIFEKGSIEWKKVIVDKRAGREELVRTGKLVLDAPPATKLVQTISFDSADDYVVMKAETGAVGRALGMAGMLVIPGTGIATAEDMQEVRQAPDGGGAEAAELPEDVVEAPTEVVEPTAQAAVEGSDEELRAQAKGFIAEMAERFPDTLDLFKAWADERGYKRLSEVTSPALRGLVRKAENMLTDAKKAAETAPAEEPEPEPEPEVEDVKPPAADPLES